MGQPCIVTEVAELAINVEAIGTPEGIESNVKYSLSLGLREFTMAPCINGGKFILCASGPSIKDYVEEIRQDQKDGFPICAIKGAYDFLRERDITPNIYLSVEPRYRPIKDPSDKTTYFMASRCHPQDFDEMIEKKLTVVLWHSWTNQEEAFYKGTLGVGGGSTSGLRALNIAYLLGFKKIKMYGMDSCNIEGVKRVGQGKLARIVKTIGVQVGERVFNCNMAMAAQAQDFQMLWDIMPDIRLEVMGDGLLAAICKERVKMGFPV